MTETSALFGTERVEDENCQWFGPHLYDNWCYVDTDPEAPLLHTDWDRDGFIAGGWTK